MATLQDTSGALAEKTRLIAPLMIGHAIFLLCLFGILTRPHVDLAALWPANAAMLGLMLRFPELVRWESWLSCTIGFLSADLLTGTSLSTAAILTTCNLLAVGTGYLLLAHRPQQDRMLSDPGSVLYFLRAIVCSALVAGVAGGIVNPILFKASFLNGFAFWSSAELVNYIALLPIFLTLPATESLRAHLKRKLFRGGDLGSLLPFVLLILLGVLGMQIGGLAVVALPVPALLWCATRYTPFATACLSFLYVSWALLSLRAGALELLLDLNDRAALIYMRLGIALVALAPIFVVGVITARNRMMNRLRYYAERDTLTGLRNRRAFFESSGQLLRAGSSVTAPFAAMIISIDNFKALVGDHGHDEMEHALAELGPLMEQLLRPDDLIGRIELDEFAVLLPNCWAEDATELALQIANTVRDRAFSAGGDSGLVEPVRMILRIGVHQGYGDASIYELMRRAGAALDGARESGSDGVVVSADPKRV